MTGLLELQRWLYAGAIDALGRIEVLGWAAVPGLLAAALGFGMLHALLPGHGKAVLSATFAGRGSAGSAVLSAVLLIATHVGTAIILVIGGFSILERGLGQAGRAPMLEYGSNLLILLIGIWLGIRAFRADDHHHERAPGVGVGLAAGFVPCPLTTFIMTYAVSRGMTGSGLVLSTAFGMGMIVTVSFFPLIAVLVRTRLVRLNAFAVRYGPRLRITIEAISAIAIMLIGALGLLSRWA